MWYKSEPRDAILSISGEIWRKERLLNCLNRLDPLTKMKIKQLSDHEGWLTVEWLLAPVPRQRKAVNKQWELAGEQTTTVTHFVNGEELK